MYICIVKSKALNKCTNKRNQNIKVQTNEIKVQTTRSKIVVYGDE